MIKTELRIGNPCRDHVGRDVEILELLEDYTRVKINPENKEWISIGYEQLQPIKLSREILVQLGFKSNPYLPDLHNIGSEHYNVVIKGDDFIFRGLGASIIEVKYLHELINLYYALTKQELILNKSL